MKMSDTREGPKKRKERDYENPVLAPIPSKGAVLLENKLIKIGYVKYKDTRGGFLLEEKSGEEDTPQIKDSQPAATIIEPDRPICGGCQKPFATSWLFDKFDHKCCDMCREADEYKLVPKTEAKDTYLLKDFDFDIREPPLKFIKQKNPHNPHWGDMKLYLELQVKKRALQVWGSMEKIEEEQEARREKRELAKAKKLEKHLKELRKGMRSSLFDRTSRAAHAHTFGEETYDEENDTYHRACTSCPYEETYEKM